MLTVRKLSFPGLGINEFEIDSIAFSIGKISVSWYSLIITTGILVAVLYVWFRFKENNIPLDDLLDFALWVVPCGIAGARIYYIIFELEHYIITTEGSFFANLGASLWKMIAVWNGGLAIYGGIIAGGLAAVLVARHKKINIFKVLDMLAPAVMLAQSIGRWGNFTNVEAFGTKTTLPWRMCSPRVASNFYGKGIVDAEGYYAVLRGEIGAHPTFFYESLWNLIGFMIIYFVFVRIKKYHKFEGQIFYMYIAWYGFGRMFIEALRTDSLYLFGIIRISQLVGLVAFGVGVTMLVLNFLKLKKVENKNGKNN